MAKRGENIRKRKDGRWEGRYIKGRKSDRTAIWGYIYGHSYNDVKEKLMLCGFIRWTLRAAYGLPSYQRFRQILLFMDMKNIQRKAEILRLIVFDA